jgi:hypothetical protein
MKRKAYIRIDPLTVLDWHIENVIQLDNRRRELDEAHKNAAEIETLLAEAHHILAVFIIDNRKALADAIAAAAAS